jgi:hypothetical protein
MENKTGCQCPLSGYCDRHKMTKNPHYHHLCQTNQKYFEMWEECRGPGQEHTDCGGKQPENKKPVDLPKEKPPCNCSQPKPEPQLPSLWEQAKNFGSAVVEHVATGMKKTEEELAKERLSICDGCEFFLKDSRRCGKCGCYMEIKARWAETKCPLGKW